jgi:hypothetical protein
MIVPHKLNHEHYEIFSHQFRIKPANRAKIEAQKLMKEVFRKIHQLADKKAQQRELKRFT